MDWYTLLFASKWAIIGLFYFVLMVLLFGVYRESASRVDKTASPTLYYGRLRVLSPGSDTSIQTGKIFDLKINTTLGAEEDNDVLLQDKFISRHHARMYWDGAVWWLEDLASKNGVLLNNQPIPPRRPQETPPHAIIAIGDILLELVD